MVAGWNPDTQHALDFAKMKPLKKIEVLQACNPGDEGIYREQITKVNGIWKRELIKVNARGGSNEDDLDADEDEEDLEAVEDLYADEDEEDLNADEDEEMVDVQEDEGSAGEQLERVETVFAGISRKRQNSLSLREDKGKKRLRQASIL
jgi:hypothetical protein